jgi:hypothetical protein
MENQKNSSSIQLSISILIGLMVLGFFIYKGLKTFSDKDRVVTVKGLAEMNMIASSATINICFSISGDDLKDILQKSEKKKTAITQYLESTGINNKEIKLNNVDVNDRQDYYDTQWIDGKRVKIKVDRYTVTQSIEITSKDVKNTENLVSKLRLDLVSKDLTSNISSNYVFPELNTIKPQLIAESTKNARISGEQFANDSQAKLGKIKTASQGQITLAGRYYYNEDGTGEYTDKPAEPYIQRARVVSTIVFFLE